ncbi:type II toxin-antitoxin system RelE/ParE family toxin [candidate division KSB1 bacterium]|nr:type II toxin-antitoxin system RelE/ParE family toxin [candidate division KSB1 bacterium]
MYEIEYAEGTSDDLKNMHAQERKHILDKIDEQLSHEPATRTRNRKPLFELKPSWEHLQPVWELRVGEFRVFYDIDEVATLVTIRVIRHKPPHKTTEEIL